MSEGSGPAAWVVMAFGRVQTLVLRADVAEELVCNWRESDQKATAVPLYTWSTVEAERERCAAEAAPEHIPFSDEEWRIRCEIRDAILGA